MPSSLSAMSRSLTPIALAVLATVLLAVSPGSAGDGEVVRLVSSSADGLVLDVDLSGVQLRPLQIEGRACVEIAGPALEHVAAAGHPDLPVVARLLAVPPGARVRLQIVDEQVEEVDGVYLAPAPDTSATRTVDAAAYGLAGLQPPAAATIEELGLLRGVRAFALRLYPARYDAASGRLRLTRRLRLQVHFLGGAAGRTASARESSRADRGDPLLSAFVNAPAASWRAPAPAPRPLANSGEWYDPQRPWVKVRVQADGVYQLTPAWLAGLGIDASAVDPRTLRLLYLGEEQYLHVPGEEDGRFDAGDEALFYGRYRRMEGESGPARDFDSAYGRANTYWLTWGDEAGQRFETRSGAPDNGYAESEWYWTTTHIERDCTYQQFEYAPDDAEGDHWFWQCGAPSKFPYPDKPGAATFTGELSAPWLEGDYTARLRVGLRGHTAAGQHHSFIKLNGRQVAERIWAGQVSYTIEEEVPSSWLRSGTNRVILQGIADLAPADWVWFNWFAVDHRRHYDAWPGFLAWDEEAAPAGRRVTLRGLASEQVTVFDVTNGVRLTGLSIDTLGSLYTVTFEHAPDAPARYVAVDRSQVRLPAGEIDHPSAWRAASNGADYVVLTHPRFEAAAAELATHRANQGLATAVVRTDDVYDEFGYGRFSSGAIRDFITYAYHHWQTPPAYVLLFGDGTWDYRNIYGSYVPSFVPTLYYHPRDRGISPSDYLYALVDGDDLLADLSIGRFGVETAAEAASVAAKVIDYDLRPAPGDWRSRAVYTAAWHAKDEFSGSSDSLAARFTEPLGLRSTKIYDDDDVDPMPKAIGRDFLEALNDGSLVFTFTGHGAATGMWYFFTNHGNYVDGRFVPEWDYLSQVANGRRLPLVVAMSCLNGMFVHPRDDADALAEVFTSLDDGGAIAYISASAIGRTSQLALLSRELFGRFFRDEALAFGPALDVAKARTLAARSSYVDVVQTMQLFGDPAQELALAAAPEYEARELTLDPAAPTAHTEARVRAALGNSTRLGTDSIAVALVAIDGNGNADTLLYRRRPAFVGADTIEAPWLVGPIAGPRRLELSVDDGGAVLEENESNNRLEMVVEVLEAALARPVFPPDAGQVAADELILQASVPVDEALFWNGYSCEFEVAADRDFTTAVRYAGVAAQQGRCAYRPTDLDVEVAAGRAPLYWRVRLLGDASPGPWSPVRSARLHPAGDDAPAAGLVRWRQAGEQLLQGLTRDLDAADGGLRVTAAVQPCRPASASREDGFTPRDLAGAGVVCTDGAYVYAKRWFDDASTLYPGTDFFTRVGTGYGGTERARNYGAFGDSTTAGISATYHGDGYIYNESGRAYELERFDPRTGRLDTVAVPDGLLERERGRVQDGHSLITSDGRLVYNVAVSIPGGYRTAWGVRVFDPADGWHLVREFASPPTETAFTFEYTDGILADGQHLYFVEYGGRRRIRMVSAVDGTFLDEWTSDQDTTRVISGQYDWVNNKVWLGDLLGGRVFRYTGVERVGSGQLIGGAVGPAAAWGEVGVAASPGAGDLSVTLEALSLDADTGDSLWAPPPGYGDVAPGQVVDLSGLNSIDYPFLRLGADIRDSTGTARLTAWHIDYRPRPSLELAGATADVLPAPIEGKPAVAVRSAVRNLGPQPAAGARISLELDDGTVLSSRDLDTLGRGLVVVTADTVPLPALGRRLLAAVTAAEADADPADNRREIPLLFEGRAPVEVRLWPAGRAFLDGDPLRPGQGLVVAAPPVREPRLVLALDGEPAEADSLLPDTAGYGLRILARPALTPGRHQLQARLFSGLEEVGLRTVEIRAVEGLAVSSALVHPHPVRDRADFTFVLSEPAEVTVDLYTLAGRQVRRLGPAAADAGFGRLPWDGRSRNGDSVASGTYLYLLRARAADGQQVTRREPFVVVR